MYVTYDLDLKQVRRQVVCRVFSALQTAIFESVKNAASPAAPVD